MDKALGHPGGEVGAGSGVEGWQPISSAPKDGTVFAAWQVVPTYDEDLRKTVLEGSPCVAQCVFGEAASIPLHYRPQGQRITHWMRLPAPPDHIADAGKMIPSPQPPVQPPASEDSRAELNRLAKRVKELEGALRAILPDAELGTFVSERTYSFGGDHTQPAEMGFSWYWQQTRISQGGEVALREEIDAFLQESAENEVDLNVLRARSALNQGVEK